MRWNVLMFPAGPSSSYLLPLKQREPPISSAPVYITRSRSSFRPTFYLSFFFLSIPFPPPFSLLASNDRVIELKIIADLEKFCGRAQISTADKGQRPYRTVDLAALVSRCASFFLFFSPPPTEFNKLHEFVNFSTLPKGWSFAVRERSLRNFVL